MSNFSLPACEFSVSWVVAMNKMSTDSFYAGTHFLL